MVWVTCALLPGDDPHTQVSHDYPLHWRIDPQGRWDSLYLARALLVDLCDAHTYQKRVDLHRMLATEVLAALPANRWVLTQAQLVDWLVAAHSACIWRRRAAVEPAPSEPWPWQESDVTSAAPTTAAAAGAADRAVRA
jgi:hypothetical protein